MSKHTSKYFQLIKILRTQKQMVGLQKSLRQQRVKMKLNRTSCVVNEQIISQMIDKDNSEELNQQDMRITRTLSQLSISKLSYKRLWNEFKEKSYTFSQAFSLLPMQKQINLMKDENYIEKLVEVEDKQRLIKEQKFCSLITKIYKQRQEIAQIKKSLDEHTKEVEDCQKQFINLKTDFQNEDKKIHQRSKKFKQEKSKDNMIKNINTQDQQMRNAMMCRIKLNQELDFSFQLQRRKAFNQAKQAINQKKKIVLQKVNKIKTIYIGHQKNEQELQRQKIKLEQQINILDNQMICFLKNLIKYFAIHSKGIKWMVERLNQMKIQLTKADFPQQLSNQDKQFLQSLFHIKNDSQKQKIKKINKTSYKQQSILNNSTKNNCKIEKINTFKTQPDIQFHKGFKSFAKTSIYSPINQPNRKTTVHFDIDNVQQDFNKSEKSKSQAKRFNTNQNSLKKVYQNTGDIISDLIKKNEWNYQSCGQMTTSNFFETQIRDTDDKKIKDKIRINFINIRHNVRRNNMKRLIFGEKESK